MYNNMFWLYARQLVGRLMWCCLGRTTKGVKRDKTPNTQKSGTSHDEGVKLPNDGNDCSAPRFLEIGSMEANTNTE